MLVGWRAGDKPLESFYGPEMKLSSTASKLDASLAWFAALAERAAQTVINRFGMDAILARNAELSRHLHRALAPLRSGLPDIPESGRSTILSAPVKDVERTVARLRGEGIVAASRAGRVRLSVHFYNVEEEIDAAARICAES